MSPGSVESDEAAAQETAYGQAPFPPVVVGIADDKTGEDEEEIDGQIAMRKDVGLTGIEDVEDKHHQRCHAAQAVKNLVMRFRLECIHLQNVYIVEGRASN